MILSSGRFFNEATSYILFFEGSLNGLNVGAPVQLSGVRVGAVTDITLIYDHKDDSISVPVTIEIERKRFHEINVEHIGEPGGGMRVHIDDGLRAQLKPQSMLTGKLRIELGYHTNTAVVLRGGEQSLIEIPTISGSIAMARASPARFRMPPLISDGMYSSNPDSPTNASLSEATSRRVCSSKCVYSSSGTITFSAKVSELHSAPC